MADPHERLFQLRPEKRRTPHRKRKARVFTRAFWPCLNSGQGQGPGAASGSTGSRQVLFAADRHVPAKQEQL